MPAEAARPKIRIVLIDDHIIVRMGLAFAINNQPDMEVVAQAVDGEEAVEVCRRSRPEVAILDLRMPRRGGIETIGAMSRDCPTVRILVLSNYSSGDEVASAFQAGARGFLAKDTPIGDLLDALRKVHAHEEVLPLDLARRLAGRLASHLSPREIEVLTLIGRGRSNKEIAAAIDVVEGTVKMHVTNILAKLGVADRTQAVLAAVKRGIIQLE
jgi:DNA-binding NarL/FixJ family response regulator